MGEVQSDWSCMRSRSTGRGVRTDVAADGPEQAVEATVHRAVLEKQLAANAKFCTGCGNPQRVAGAAHGMQQSSIGDGQPAPTPAAARQRWMRHFSEEVFSGTRYIQPAQLVLFLAAGG